jgi:hypothetical protein
MDGVPEFGDCGGWSTMVVNQDVNGKTGSRMAARFIRIVCSNRIAASRLALAELESPSGALAAEFFALFDPGISGKETELPESGTEIGICFQQGFADSVANSARLAADAAAFAPRDHIVPAHRLCNVKRLLDESLQYQAAQVFIRRAIVYHHAAASSHYPHAGHGVFAFSCSIISNCWGHKCLLLRVWGVGCGV